VLRYYEDGAWYVHKNHIDDVKQLGVMEAQTTTSSGPDDYAVLYLHRDAPVNIVEIVWRALAKLHHPDRGGDEETFKKISAAYQRIKGGLDE
jgi:DnaJ-class molecular chaperone